MTGESVPVLKEAGANVYAGSINANGELRVSISHVAADNTIARIIHMVEEAQESKAPTARMIDRFSRWYTPGAMVVAALIVVVPPLAFGGDWMTWVYRGLATLLIACPCALVISTPAAIASGLAAGARQGLLIKGGAALETLGKVVTVAFDKTGTLTRGHPQVTDIVPINGDENSVLAIAAAVERSTSHPLGVAIVEAAKVRGLELPATFGGGVATPGKAVTARLKDGFASVGSPRHAAEQATLEENVAETITTLESQGKTVVVLMKGKTIEGLIALRDEPRDDAIEGVKRLTDRGVRPLMLTGDNKRTADAIAAHLGLEASAELLPDAKLAEIGRLRADGPIAMVGDGINDAPALAAAHVSMAPATAADIGRQAADFVFMQENLDAVPFAIETSQRAGRLVRQNFALAIGYNVVAVPIAIAGYATPMIAAIAMSTSSLVVVANALRLAGAAETVRPRSDVKTGFAGEGAQLA